MRLTLSKVVARIKVRSTSSVTLAPAFLKILASPDFIPTIRSGSMRESIQVIIAKPFLASPVNSWDLNPLINSAFAANMSSNELINL